MRANCRASKYRASLLLHFGGTCGDRLLRQNKIPAADLRGTAQSASRYWDEDKAH